ncbi:MAG: molybdopterin-guanine dinucleotide biosynthesis protein B [Candidatus Lokiarchaeota archaeon]|nr:molybdopterin-guanine dinucleotide biosynthesis protein B [Candidatus Lokiarchaeota archaeon]
MNNGTPRIIALKGYSNSGKTTSLESLLRYLTSRQFSSAVIKNIHKEKFTIDHPGKDTWRLKQAGGDPVISYSNDEIAIITNKSLPVDDTIQILLKIRNNLNYIFLEGFWQNAYPKILFLRELDDLDLLMKEFSMNPIRKQIMESICCFSGVYFVNNPDFRDPTIKKIEQLRKNYDFLNKLHQTHLETIPVVNIKENPEKFFSVFTEFQTR